MAISFTRYIDITSGVGAGAVVERRDLIGRLFTVNNLLPPQSFIQFENIDEVGSYFGTDSDEYARAVPYFSFVSKSLTRPQKIQFARWVQTAVAPRIYGNPDQAQLLATYTAITAGSFGMTIGADVNTFTGLDFSGAASLAAVATILQTAIQTKVGTMWTSATVTYNATRGTFDFVGGSTTAAEISVQQGVGGTPIGIILGWLPESANVNGTFTQGAIWAAGSAIESITDTLTDSAQASDDFGTFLFMPALSVDQIVEAATWNKAQNVKYIYCVPVITANTAAYITALEELGGTGVTLSDFSDQYPEEIPMEILAATNYNAPNAVQNYMYQQVSGITPGVTTDSVADSLDAGRINYYGRTQSAGQFIDFYQRGVLMGIASDPLDMNVYANEIWLKDALGAALMTLLLSLNEVPANSQGRSMILSTLQSVINEALNNGVISVGKTLSNEQKMFITEITADPQAYYQVQTIGYWVNVTFVLVGNEYEAVYTLVYSKDDIIRKVVGSNVLI